MREIKACLMVTCLLTVMAIGEARAETLAPSSPKVEGAGDGKKNSQRPPTVLTYGGLAEREPHLQRLYEFISPEVEIASETNEQFSQQLNEVRRYVLELAKAYARRASRQQRFMDFEAAAVFVGGLGYALGGGAGTTTPKVWASLSFGPLFLNQIHSNDPTRDLFHSGVQALAVMAYRYQAIETLNSGLGRAKAIEETYKAVGTKCESRSAVQSELRNSSVQLTDVIALLEVESEKLFEIKSMLNDQSDEVKRFHRGYSDYAATSAQNFAQEVVALDHQMLAQDRHLRHSPLEAIGLIIATPLKLLTTSLTGEDANRALNTMKSTLVLSQLDQTLSTAHLPAVSAPITVTDLDLGLSSSPVLQTYSELVDCLRDAHRSLRQQAIDQEESLYLIEDARRVVEANQLKMRFDWQTGITTVALEKPTMVIHSSPSTPVIVSTVGPAGP